MMIAKVNARIDAVPMRFSWNAWPDQAIVCAEHLIRVAAGLESAIVGEDGSELGRHDGYWRFTPGQRRGLGLAAPEPLYVLDTRPSVNAVVVGPRESLARSHVDARGRLYVDVERVEAKLRYRSASVPARVEPAPGGFRLELDEPAYGVASGQAAVLYDADAVVGYGLIASSH